MEKGRYYRNRFVAISEVILRVIQLDLYIESKSWQTQNDYIVILYNELFQKWIQEHKEDYRGNRTGDLQDAYLKKISEGIEGFTEEGLSAMLRELFVIGAEAQSVMLR